ncbi:MAG: DUF1565 domain-containing protein [Phycisphaerae bacterium]|nr:DUF1565 domain-containing protein [Phycisphaerae bacterium]
MPPCPLFHVVPCALSILTFALPALAADTRTFDPIDPFIVEQLRSSITGRTIIVDWNGTWDFATIQEALDAAVDGDTIIVLPSTGSPAGAYVENILFPAKSITLRSIKPDDPVIVAATVIDGNQAGTVVTFDDLTPEDATFEGFTVRNGGALVGGGMYLNNAFLRITKCTISDNFAYVLGGGIYITDGAPVLESVEVLRNSSDRGGGIMVFSADLVASDITLAYNHAGGGGGLYLSDCDTTLSNFMITRNTASNDGAGLYVYDCNPTLLGFTTRHNYARYDGGGIFLDSASPQLANSVILENSAGMNGGGMYLDGSSPTLANNTIASNTAQVGAGIYLADRSSPTVTNTIVAHNLTGIYMDPDRPGSPVFRSNCFFGEASFSGAIPDPTGMDDNISVDPKFGDLGCGNVHLQFDSPCKHAGDNAFAIGDHDIDGQPRVLPEGGKVDIGADEWDREVWPAGPTLVVRVSPDGDDAYDGSSWSAAKRTVQAGIDAAAATCGEVWVQGGTYHERVNLPPYVYLYGGFNGSETARTERDWKANITTLDGDDLGSVVVAEIGHHTSRIDGFTLTHGHATWGGGMRIWSASPAVANMTVTSNHAESAGGISLYRSYSDVVNSIFSNNSADNCAGVSVSQSPIGFVSCTISGNTAGQLGGGICLGGPAVRLKNCSIRDNTADKGGGIYVTSSTPQIVSTIIHGNTAETNGGGVYVSAASPGISNSTISSNRAKIEGGGLYFDLADAEMANCTVVANNSYLLRGGAISFHNSSPTIANSVFAFNYSGIYRQVPDSAPLFRNNSIGRNMWYDYSGLSDQTGIDGNISAETLFLKPPGVGHDGLWGTSDDDLGDLRLIPGSPCIDAGDNSAVPADVADLDGDGDTTEPLPLDLAGMPRFTDDLITPDTGGSPPPVVDMGAYETPSRGDCDGSASINLSDFALVANCLAGPGMTKGATCTCSDVDLDGDTDLLDFSFLQLAIP